MTTLQTWTSVSAHDATAVLDALLGHLAEHEMVAISTDKGRLLDYEGAEVLFRAEGETVRVEITAPTQDALFDARMMAHHHVAEYAGCEMEAVKWEGDQPRFERPPAFRALTVLAVEDLSPHLRRVRFRGDNLARYAREEDIHCKLFLPQPGVSEPEWPTLGSDGMPRFPVGEKRLEMRTYTIRRIDEKAGWMDIDFVLHEDAGPGSTWAAHAQPGHQVGISGPGGRTARPAAWMLLAGDETGLPAIARIAESLPAHTQGKIFIEVQGPDDEIPLTVPSGMQLTWLHRGIQAAGTTTMLNDAVLGSEIPADGDRFVWVAGEFATAQAVRPWLRNTVGLGGKDQLVVAYWRLGMDETSMKGGGARAAAGKSAGQEEK